MGDFSAPPTCKPENRLGSVWYEAQNEDKEPIYEQINF